jgi:hypothetical protein
MLFLILLKPIWTESDKSLLYKLGAHCRQSVERDGAYNFVHRSVSYQFTEHLLVIWTCLLLD